MTAAVPERLLPHTVTVVTPHAGTDGYGNTVFDYGDEAERTTVSAWLQQDQRAQVAAQGADPLKQKWLMVTNHTPIHRRARIEWASSPTGPLVFELDGQPNPNFHPFRQGAVHHTELALTIVDG
ncbi:hypothetical protein [Streptomyces sp. N35]|uniref:hypothetical protein n=1 Tax=Streptomyces sp. N35 TaxID=2795730 RepID=UPI0018F2861C|nr:hypothetical protein [Streptomyces sp. N35]